MNPESNLSSRNSNNGTAYHTLPILRNLMTVYLALMNLKFLPPNNIGSPFETHPLIMSMFIIAILVYAITLCTSYFPEIISNISLLSGSLAPVLLTLILSPGLGWFILLLWVIYFVKIIYHACQKLYQLYEANSSVSDLFNQLLLGRHGHNDESNSGTASNHRHAILGFPIKVLLALMPLKFQSTNIAGPFETHSAIMSIFVAATLVYAVAGEIEAQLQTSNNSNINHAIIICKISLFSGSLATVLLVLVIVPVLGWLVLLVWTLFLVKQIYDACQKLHQLYQELSSVSDVFNEVLGGRGHQNELGRIG